VLETGTRAVYAVQRDERTVYCSSPACIQSLLGKGWQLSDPRQLTALVRELASGAFRVTHQPEDHF
jgi:hypothetical protein